MLIIALIGVILLVPKVSAFALKIALQGGIGAIFMMLINIALTPLGLFVGINFVTVGIAGLLGIPGVVSMYILQFLI